jgi:hypothetical protein
MIQIKFDGISTAKQRQLTQARDDAARLAAMFNAGTHRALLIEWFGAGADTDGGLLANLRLMQTILDDSMRTVTFVERTHGSLQVNYNPDNIAQPPVLMPPGSPAAGLAGTAAYAFPTDARGQSETKFHVGSGMRIYIGPTFGTRNQTEDAQTVYHEMTHKVLGTNDHAYDPNPCRALALADPASARKNADNYAYFVTSLGGHRW